MSDKQVQEVGENAVAVQGKGDVTVNLNKSISIEQMAEIIDFVAKRVDTFIGVAQQKVEERLEDFKNEVLPKFADGQSGRAEAFADPDFLHVLHSSQTAYARSGDKELHGVLVDLIIERSKLEKRNRLTLTLNDAIAKASLITADELSILSILFLMRRVRIGAANLETLATNLSKTLEPSVDSFPLGESSFHYLESIGCLKIGTIITQSTLYQAITANYPDLMTRGISKEDFIEIFSEDELPDQKISLLHTPSPFDENLVVASPMATLLLFHAQNDAFKKKREKYVEKCRQKLIPEAEFAEIVHPKYPVLKRLSELFNETLLRRAEPTSVGIALAHANLSSAGTFGADLSIWIN